MTDLRESVRLHVEDRPAVEGTVKPLVLLHGFTGSVGSMEQSAVDLGGERRVLSIDLVGHGRSPSPRDPSAYRMDRCIGQVLDALDAQGVECADWLGYSMGGRVALSLAVRHPERVRRLVLVGASPGLDDPEARRERVRADEALADRILDEGLESFVDRWMALPLFASQRRLGEGFLAASRAQRLQTDPAGLAASLRGRGTGAMPPLHDRLGGLARPVLLVVGEDDAKFRGVARSLEAALPDARTVVIAAAGHAAHLENPDAFRAAVHEFLDAEARPSRTPANRRRAVPERLAKGMEVET